MPRHGSGYDFGLFGELTYRLFRRSPTWLGFVLPVAIFLIPLAVADAILRPSISLWALLVVPVVAFAISMLLFEMALITYLTRAGRWKMLHLYGSLREIRSLGPREFERLVGAAYEQRGYTVDFAPVGRDGGVDLIMRRRDETVIVQCKNWYRAFTGVHEVRELFGALHASHATRAAFVSSGVFSEDAETFARQNAVELIDGEALLDMIDSVHDSVADAASSSGPKAAPSSSLNPDKPCPICGSPTVRKTAHRGENSGSSFWSCSRWPDCSGVAPE